MDNINPSHYKDSCSMECFDVMLGILGSEAVMNGCLMNVVKYLWRYKDKGGIEDIEKAQWYLSRADIINSEGLYDIEMFERVKSMFNAVKMKECL